MVRVLLVLLAAITIFPVTVCAQVGGENLIHATVEFEEGGIHTGYLRWESEEAGWDHLFHCGYRENPWIDFIDTEALKKEKRDRYYESHGLLKRLAYALEEDDSVGPGWRMFLIRFGDIESFEIRAGKDDFITTTDGSRHRIGGYANDNGSDLWLYEKDKEPLKIEWNDLVSIKFSSAPKDHQPYAQLLYGTVETTGSSLTGPIVWDKSECMDIDELDGENSDGDLTILMGAIRSIEKKDNRSVLIVEKDGSSYGMSGTNDVDSGNRGIWVLTEDQGWISVPWKRFIKATFSNHPGSGNPRGAFGNNQPLVGTVHLTDGAMETGRLVYDLDEGFAWDIFNGSHNQMDYDIPFTQINKIENLHDKTCRVHLQSGIVLELSGNQDTGDDHGGMLVFSEGLTDAEFIPWRLVETIIFSR